MFMPRGLATDRIGARPRAFTLVELLVVISVISLLMALLLPVLSRAQTAGRITQGLSQARQVTIALFMYADTSNTSMPYSLFFNDFAAAADNSSASTATGHAWGGKLIGGGLLSDPRSLWSPARNVGVIDANATNWRNMGLNPQHAYYAQSGFGINTHGVTGAQIKGTIVNGHRFAPLKLGQVRSKPATGTLAYPFPDPSRCLLLTEMFRIGMSPAIDGWYSATTDNASNKGFTYDRTMVRTFLDGSGAARDGLDLGWNATNDRDGTWTVATLNGNAPWYRLP